MGHYRCINCKHEDETVELRQTRKARPVRLCARCWLGKGNVALVRLQHDREATSKFLQETYDLTIEDYERLVLAQHGRCAICGERPGPDRRLAVDHSHSRARVRGLLCHRCNTAIGLLGDDTSRLHAAIDYLKNPPAKEALGQRRLTREECIEARIAKPRGSAVNRWWSGPGTQVPT